VGDKRYHFVVVSYRDIRHPEFGGAEVIIYEIFRRYAAAGHRVSFLTGHWRGAAESETIEGMEIHRFGNQYNFNFLVPGRLRRLLAETPADLVVEDINKIPFFTPVFQKQSPVLGVVPHLFGTTVFQQAPFPLALYVYLYEQFIPMAYRGCRFSVLSNTTCEDLMARGIPRERMRLIRGGLDHDYHKPIQRVGRLPKPVILYLGRIKKYKRIELVIDALPKVLETVPEAQYWIVGDGDYLPELKSLVARRNLADHVKFLGYQDGEEKYRTLEQTRVLAYTSPKEGWGLSVIEGNALGIPCVASNSPGLRESVRDGETGYLVPHGDVAALADRLSELLGNDDTWRKMGESGINWAATFNWDRAAAETLELSEEIIAEWKASK
jgi:glycosyltransferase involved in cell wall biosynthesis